MRSTESNGVTTILLTAGKGNTGLTVRRNVGLYLVSDTTEMHYKLTP